MITVTFTQLLTVLCGLTLVSSLATFCTIMWFLKTLRKLERLVSFATTPSQPYYNIGNKLDHSNHLERLREMESQYPGWETGVSKPSDRKKTPKEPEDLTGYNDVERMR